jgi:hypothetical protein
MCLQSNPTSLVAMTIMRFLTSVTVVALLSTGSATAGTEDCAYRQSDTEVLRLCRPRAENGDASAQYAIGFMYAQGRGVPQDNAEAIKWFRMAADQGYAHAQNSLGVRLEEAQDYVEAAKWYRKAADQGEAGAQHNLGAMYDRGQGVPQDYVIAHMWLNLAAAQGSEAARRHRDELAAKMIPDQIAQAQRLAREWRPPK